MYGMSAAVIKSGRTQSGARSIPKEGTKLRQIYDELMRLGEIRISEKYSNSYHQALLGLDLNYGIVTRRVGKKHYKLVSLDGG